MNSEAAEAIVGASVTKETKPSVVGISIIGSIDAKDSDDPVVDWNRLDPARRSAIGRAERYFREEPNLKANDIFKTALALHFRGNDVLSTYIDVLLLN